ncbi:hypothetical protein NQZ68_032666 [Dissostichus eleginoides]|nr:hypothetical protein NQZ68_032666 [Dissostichus eleginoides]
MSWRKTVLSWVCAGKRTTSPDIEQTQEPTSLQSEFQSVSEETEAIRESNRVLFSQIEQVNVETAQNEDLMNRLKLERDPAILREKLQAAQEEKQNLEQRNDIMRQEIFLLGQKCQRDDDIEREEKENLMRDIDFFHKEIERKNKLHGKFLRIKREKCKMAFENSLLRVDFEALLVKLTANETRTRDSDFLTTGKDTASLLRDDVTLKLREMQEIRERIGAMEEENDTLLLAHAQELCKERPKIGPWTIQINRGARMNQRSWAYEVC